MMSSHLFFVVDPCFQIAKRIMINGLQMMEADTIPDHVVCMYYVVCIQKKIIKKFIKKFILLLLKILITTIQVNFVPRPSGTKFT